LEEDDAKVNSNVLEPSFNFEGAVLEGADFSKAKLLVAGMKEPITVEEAIKLCHVQKNKPQPVLSIPLLACASKEKGLLLQHAVAASLKQEEKVARIEEILNSIFTSNIQTDENTRFAKDEKINKDFCSRFKKEKNDAG
jgi:hypothetical protein